MIGDMPLSKELIALTKRVYAAAAKRDQDEARAKMKSTEGKGKNQEGRGNENTRHNQRRKARKRKRERVLSEEIMTNGVHRANIQELLEEDNTVNNKTIILCFKAMEILEADEKSQEYYQSCSSGDIGYLRQRQYEITIATGKERGIEDDGVNCDNRGVAQVRTGNGNESQEYTRPHSQQIQTPMSRGESRRESEENGESSLFRCLYLLCLVPINHNHRVSSKLTNTYSYSQGRSTVQNRVHRRQKWFQPRNVYKIRKTKRS